MQGEWAGELVGPDVWQTCRELIPPRSVFAFLAEHRQELFPATMFADMYPSATAHDYAGPGKPPIAWNDEQARKMLVDALVTDAILLPAHLPEQPLGDKAASAVALLSLVAYQDVEPAEDSDGRDGRWRIARSTVHDRIVSTVDADSRRVHKNRTQHQDGYKAHLAVEPDSGIYTALALRPGTGAAPHKPSCLSRGAWKAGMPSSEGAPAQQCAGATRRFTIRRQRKRGTQKYFIYTKPSKKAIQSIKDKVRGKVNRATLHLDLDKLLTSLNRMMRGWANYFRYGVSKQVSHAVDQQAWHRLAKWIHHKHSRLSWS
jgi:hypothetical protein